MKPSNLGFITSSPLFKSKALKTVDNNLTDEELLSLYGYMEKDDVRRVRQQMQAAGRPLTIAEQRAIMGTSKARPSSGPFGEMSKGSKLAILGVLGIIAYSMYVAYNVDTQKKVYVF